MLMKQKTIETILLTTFALVFAACSPQSFESQGQHETTEQGSNNYHPYDVNLYKMNKVVCDPMGNPGNPGPNDGLIAELFYLNSNQPHYQNVLDYIMSGTKSTQKLFFSDLNVPTRLFNTGFPTQTGAMVKDDAGNDLIEYFGLRFKSVLKLSEDDEAGEYEMALLSDDGAIMKVVDDDGVQRVVVDNDHDHPTRMGCGGKLQFNHATAYDVVIDYYQGPRYHISLIPMWRKVTANTQPETECGQLGNERYFDYNNNSTPQQKYLAMLARGWKPIHADNWHLPPMAIYNPCTEGKAPVISNFTVIDTREGEVIVRWNTDVPATAQVLVRDSQGNETVTSSDNVLRTQHQVVVGPGTIQFGQTYSFQGISISADMGKAMSRVIEEYID